MKICVIGSGPSGLTTIKQLLDERHEVTAFETQSDIGGIWNRSADGSEDEVKVFDSLILTISAKLMSFSDFMVRDRVFYTHRQYREYLEAYAQHFGLRRHIEFRSTVQEIRRTAAKQWAVRVSRNGEHAEHVFDAIAICSGPFQTPNFDVAGLASFTGEVVHSSRYRNNGRFRGKRVLVVGLAESGADVVREISEVASDCTLALRSYPYLLPRVICGHHATDAATCRALDYEGERVSRRHYPMRALWGDDRVSRFAFSVCSKIYGLAAVASNAISSRLRPVEAAAPDALNPLGQPLTPLKLDLDTEYTEEVQEVIDEWNRRSNGGTDPYPPRTIFAKNVAFIPHILNGNIALNDSGVESMQAHRVCFGDGTSKEFDVVVLCTGFVRDFSRLGNDLSVPDNNVRNLYKHAFNPDHGGHVAYIGFVRPFSGGIPICAEMQARYFARLCSGALELPSDIRERIIADKAWEDAATALSPRHHEAIPSQVFFLDALAREIGCLLPMRQLLLRPRLLVRHWFYSFNQACYRLVGPHHMADFARDELMREKPGPFGTNVMMLMLMALSVMPAWVRPKTASGALPGQAKPSRSPLPHQRSHHPLRPVAAPAASAA